MSKPLLDTKGKITGSTSEGVGGRGARGKTESGDCMTRSLSSLFSIHLSVETN